MADTFQHRWLRTAVLICLAIVLAAGGYQFGVLVERNRPVQHAHVRLDGNRYTQPLLGCTLERHAQGGHPDLKKVQRSVRRVIDDRLADRAAGTIAFYVRDLRSGRWTGVNDHERFSPASLMKVPLMLAVLKHAEHAPGLLEQRYRYPGDEDASEVQLFAPARRLVPGTLYTVDELLYRSIAYSDNNAALLLADRLGMGILEQTLRELQIGIRPGQADSMISVRDFTAFFRVLFDATYLDDHQSERALGYLVNSTFNEGIRAGVPPGMTVASKFGEYSAGGYQLHEFGIVYYPGHPYLLGIVTKSGTPESLSRVIRELSETVYAEMERQHGAGS